MGVPVSKAVNQAIKTDDLPSAVYGNVKCKSEQVITYESKGMHILRWNWFK